MQQNTPERNTPEHAIPGIGNVAPVAPSGSPFTDAEWKTLIQVPVQVGRAMMAMSPAGGIGMTKEVKALRDSLEETRAATTRNPMLRELGAHLTGNMESIWSDAGHAFKDRWDAANLRQTAISSCQQVVTLVKKASPQDAIAYKEFVLSLAQKVAEAATEGGFLGIGANKQAISPEEQSLLNDITKALNMQRS